MGRLKLHKPAKRTRAERIEARMARAVLVTEHRTAMRKMFDDIFGADATDQEIAEQIKANAVSGNTPTPNKENA